MRRLSLPHPVWLLAALFTAGTLLAATTAQEVEQDHSLASDLVTPHKEWAKGYARGPVRTLFVVNMGPYDGTWSDTGTRLREVVELRERFDFDGDAVMVGGTGNGPWNFQGNELGQRRAERLLDKPYELYVLAGVPLDKLPAKIQYLIVAQVAKGAGLLCCGPAAKEAMAAKRQLTPAPATLATGLPNLDGKPIGAAATAYKLGKGRGVWLNYQAGSLTPTQEFSYRRLTEYDYRMLLVGRAGLWAAGREPEVAVTPSYANGAASVSLAIAGTQPIAGKLALALRRADDGLTRDLGTVPVNLAAGKEAVQTVTIPGVRAGDYFLDAVLRGDKGVLGCGAASLTITSPYGVDKVELAKTFVERDEAITGKVTLRGAAPAGSLLRLRFRDSYDRVLDQRDIPVAAGRAEYPFEYLADDAATILMRVEASVYSAGSEIEQQTASFTVPNRRRGQMNFVMWDAPLDVLGLYAWRKMQDAGHNICLLGSFGERPAPPALLAGDASLVPYSTRILDEKDDKGYMKPVCWQDEPAVTAYVEKIVQNQKKLREQGVFTYSLGDEGVTKGCCVHPADLAAYRRWLQGQYGDPARLNASWDSDYKTWDEVTLLDLNDNLENGALPKHPARWYDRQAYARYNLMQFSGRFVEAYKKLDPKGVTGFEGTGGFGDDYDAILRTNTFYGPYPSLGDDLVRSRAPRQTLRSNWMGYSKTADALSDAAWRMVMKGMDSIWFWMWSGVGSWRGYLTPTLSYWPATAELTGEMAPVRHGLGDLILQSQPTHSGIGVFYNLPSALADQVESGLDYDTVESDHVMLTQLTYDLGLDFRYVTSDMLKGGALDPKEFKVLVLPKCQAIAPDEAAAIRRFAEAGGTVVADLRPGVYDGHCKPTATGALDDLFGIKRGPSAKSVRQKLDLKAAFNGRGLDLEGAQAVIDPAVQAASATPLAKAGTTPLLLVNPVGAGRAMLLNFRALTPKPEAPEATAARRLWQFVYGVAGAAPKVRVTAPDGGPLPLVETRIWQNGQGLLFGSWRQMQCAWFSPQSGDVAGEPVAAKVSLPAAMHVYDLRAGKYLGQVKSLDTKLRWGRASFYLALPYPIQGVGLSLSSPQPKPGAPLEATLQLRVPKAATERHAVWLTVTDPAGQQPLWGRKTVVLERGAGTVSVPVAFNDLPGKWRLKATELFSGSSAEATWTVR